MEKYKVGDILVPKVIEKEELRVIAIHKNVYFVQENGVSFPYLLFHDTIDRFWKKRVEPIVRWAVVDENGGIWGTFHTKEAAESIVRFNCKHKEMRIVKLVEKEESSE